MRLRGDLFLGITSPFSMDGILSGSNPRDVLESKKEHTTEIFGREAREGAYVWVKKVQEWDDGCEGCAPFSELGCAWAGNDVFHVFRCPEGPVAMYALMMPRALPLPFCEGGALL